MKENGKMDLKKEMDVISFRMGTYLKANMRMENQMGQEHTIGQMEVYMKGYLVTAAKMVRENGQKVKM
jgi:hypothetical protein